MKTLHVQTQEETYPIHIGAGLLRHLPDLLRGIGWGTERPLMLVTDDRVGPLYSERVQRDLADSGYRTGWITVPAGESSKSLARLEEMVGDCIRTGLDRSGGILALGGGVVGDLAGFLAASYMRGIPFVQLPTTLLAHDSSVGGKVGVNHTLGKNMIGAFHQPSMVVFDVETLGTLPEREVASGYAEVVKHALIRDANFALWLEEKVEPLKRLEPEVVSEAILRGCAVKAEVVAKDEKESGLRAILNYGHTIGHALEAAAGYGRFTHGEAVSIGMVGAAMLAEKMELGPPLSERTAHLLSAFGLPTRLPPEFAHEELLEIMRRDKKAKGGAHTFVLPRKVGRVEIVHGVAEPLIRQVLQQLKGGRV